MEVGTQSIKNFGLDEPAFTALIEQLQAGDESLFQTIFLQHFEDCMNYLKQKNKIEHAQAYDITMDTLLIFRKKLIEGKIGYGNMRFLFTQMANQLFLKSLRKKIDAVPINGLENLLEDEPDEKIDQEAMTALNKAWDQLCADCSRLLKRFYYHKTSLQDIAIDTEKSPASIRKRKQRCVEKLRGYFTQHYPH